MPNYCCWFIVILITCIPPRFAKANVSTKYLIIGNVFFDKNQNSVRDAGEYGVGGVELVVDEKIRLLSDTSGHFEIDFQTDNFFSSIRLNLETLPPGGIVVGSADEKINIERGKVHNIDFAIYFPTINIEVPLEKKKLYENQLFLPSQSRISFKKTDQGLIDTFSKKNIIDFPQVNSSYLFDSTTLEISPQITKLKSFSSRLKIKKVIVQSPRELSRQEEKILELEFKNYFFESVKVEYERGEKYLVTVNYVEIPSCFVFFQSAKKSFQAEELISLSMDSEKRNQVRLSCGEFERILIFPKVEFNLQQNKHHFVRDGVVDLKIKQEYSINKKQAIRLNLEDDFAKGEKELRILNNSNQVTLSKILEFNRDKFSSKLNRSELPKFDLKVPKYYQDSRVNRFFFLAFPKNITEPKIFNEKLHENNAYIMNTVKSTNRIEFSGLNELGKKVKANFEYINYRENSDFLLFSMGYFNSSRSESAFNVEYSIDLILQYQIQAQYFFNHFFGARVEHSQDVYDTILTAPTGDEITGNRSSSYLGMLFNLNLTPSDYAANEYYFTVGYRTKSENYTSENTTVVLPKDYQGVELGLLAYVKFWPSSNYNWLFEGTYSNSFEESSDRILRFKSSALMNLNLVSNWLKIDNYFNYYNRNDVLEKFSFVPSLEMIYDRRQASNFENATLTSLDLIYSFGILYNF